MKRIVRLWGVAALVLALCLSAAAQTPITPQDMQALQEAYQQLLSQGNPQREVQTVYSISPWSGSTIGTGTFARKEVGTIYLVADHPNLVTVRRTEVYYWPITREYMANWFEMNELLTGRLRIKQGGQVIAELEMETYVDYYPEGSTGQRQVVFGEEALALYEEYNRRYNEWLDAYREYTEAQLNYQREVERILAQVNATGEYVAEDEVPKSPRQPQGVNFFVYPPRQAFVVNLPVGRYQVELIDEEGNVVPDTVKTLDVFAPRRTGIAYNVLPEDKWTKPIMSNDPTETFYLDGRRVFYLVPFEAEEFNEYKFRKSQDLTRPLYGEGVRSSWMWVPTVQVDPNYKLQVLRDGEVVQEVELLPYYVRQTEGYALGYNILRFDPDNPIMFGRSPSFYGYRLDIEIERGSYTIQLVDSEGNVIPSSVREIRSIRKDANWAMYGTPLLPFAVGLVVFIRRMRLRPRSGKQEVAA